MRSTAERSGGYETNELPGRLTRSKIGGGIQVEPDTDNSKGTEKVFLVHHLYHCHWKQETKAYHLEFFMFIIAYSVDPMSFFMRICGLFGDEARFGSAQVLPFGPCCGARVRIRPVSYGRTSRMSTVQIAEVQFGYPINLDVGECSRYSPVTNSGHDGWRGGFSATSVPSIWFPVLTAFFFYFWSFRKLQKPVRSHFCKYIAILGLVFGHSKLLVVGVFCLVKTQKKTTTRSQTIMIKVLLTTQWFSLIIDG